MRGTVTLHGYRFSVYTRIARVVLAEKGVGYTTEEIDPFAPDVPLAHLGMHPFGRVPVLTHGTFRLYETAAIARYIDAAFDGPPLTPTDPQAQARMAQAIAITDNYGYWPMVRQVFSHRVFRPQAGEPAREGEVSAGLHASQRVLAALDAIAVEGMVLGGATVTLADCHLAPMIDYFVAAPEGAEMLNGHPALADWWSAMREWPTLLRTDPGRPTAG